LIGRFFLFLEVITLPYVSPEIILEVKKIDLLTYLRNCEPHELVHVSGDTYSTRTHDSLKISHGKWCWWSRGIGGRSALDYLIKVNGLSFLDAVERIVGRTAVQPPAFVSSEKPTPATLLLPEAYPDTDCAEAYLHSRGIGSGIISFCISTGRIYESHNYIKASGKTYINAVVIGFDMDGNIKYATFAVSAQISGARPRAVTNIIHLTSLRISRMIPSICLKAPLTCYPTPRF
jgi:hypothetical protein